MEKVAEFTGKKVQDAVDEGLKTLGITLDDADIKIISNGGLFKKAKVLITYDDGLTEEQAAAKAAAEQAKAEAQKKAQAPVMSKPEKAKKSEQAAPPEDEPHWGSAPIKREPSMASNFGKGKEKPAAQEQNKNGEEHAPKQNKQKNPQGEKPQREHNDKKEHAARQSALPTEEQIADAKRFLTDLIGLMHIDGEVEVSIDEGMRVNVNTEDARVIGHRGEVLDAMQQLISARINSSHGNFVHVTVDGLGYRDRRKETLENLARRMAEKALRSHRKVTLDPMNSADRRIVHAALGERDDVFTRSEGHEPARRVVIVPKRK